MATKFNEGLTDGMEEQLMELLDADDAVVETMLMSGQIEQITSSFYDKQAIVKQIKEFKDDGLTKVDIAEKVDELKSMVNDMMAMASAGPNGNSPKNRLLTSLLTPSLDFMQAVYNSYDGEDCEIEIEFLGSGQPPTSAHPNDAGMDVFANVPTRVDPKETRKIYTGFKVAVPEGWQLSVRPRSGLSFKTALRVPNAPGTIDSGYHDEVAILIQNTGDESVFIDKNERIAQLVLERVYKPKWIVVDKLTAISNRANDKGEQGFGSTGA